MKKTQNDNGDSAYRKAGERMTLTIMSVKYPFRWIPAGSFVMGSPLSEQKEAANPKYTAEDFSIEVQHRVNISRGFWMLESPITRGMWRAVMGADPCYYREPDNHPVVQVSWNDCQEYVRELNDLGTCPEGFAFSLPTEAEWEYACRAGTTTPYHFGIALNGDKANCNGHFPFGTNKKGKCLWGTSKVGKYPANSWGLVDMHGNVSEWVLDWFGAYPTGEVTDPLGPETGEFRVFRGGGWGDFPFECRAAYRSYNAPDNDDDDQTGARLVLRQKD